MVLHTGPIAFMLPIQLQPTNYILRYGNGLTNSMKKIFTVDFMFDRASTNQLLTSFLLNENPRKILGVTNLWLKHL